MADASVKTLRVAIAGAGIAGLSTALALAHKGYEYIDVYETAGDLGFVGAGIQIAPNLSRALQTLGIWDYVKDDVIEMKQMSIRAAATDEELANANLAIIKERFGLPHFVAHRSALAEALYKGCKNSSSRIKVHFHTAVINVDFDNHRIQVKNLEEDGEGKWVDVDIVLGADGIKSSVRMFLRARNGEEDEGRDTGTAAYRIMLHRDELQSSPELLAMVDSNSTYRWMGPRRAIVAYPISRNTILNISTAHPDDHFASEPTASWTTKADKAALLDVFSDFCPLVLCMLNLVPEGEVCEWKLRVHDPLSTWVEGNVALVGDACHPALPHLGQGSAQAVEDAVVLGVVMGKVEDKKDIHAALKVYERLRKQRTESLVQQAATAGRTLHLTDPEAQAVRDEAFRQVKHGGPNPEKAVNKETQEFMYGHDCVKFAEDHFEEYFAEAKVACM